MKNTEVLKITKMKNAGLKIKFTRIAVLLIVVHLPLTALMPMQVGAHFLEHRTNTDHALAHTMLSCRLACTAFVFMPSPVPEVSQGLRPSFEEPSISYESLYKNMATSWPSIRGPPATRGENLNLNL